MKPHGHPRSASSEAQKKDGLRPGRFLRSRKAAHQINRMFREAVLLHARTLEPMQAMPWEYNLVSGTPRKSQGMTIRLLSDMKRKRVVLGLLVEGEGSKKKDSI